MHILFIGGYEYPFSPVDIEGRRLGALAGGVAEAEGGAEVSVVLPLYFSLPEGQRRRMRLCRRLSFLYGWRHTEASVYRLREDGVSYYFLENDRYFGREKAAGYFDDGERFAFFGYAALAAIGRCIPMPHLIVGSGWMAAPALLSVCRLPHLRRAGVRIGFFAGDIRKQGTFAAQTLGSVFAWGAEGEICLLDGNVNLLRGGMQAAERVFFPSRRAMDNLRDIHTAYGLRQTFLEVSPKCVVLADGFGREVTPGEGKYPYTPARVTEGKKQNKRAMLEALGFRPCPRPFLIGCLSLSEEEGVALIKRHLPAMLDGAGRFYFCGTASAAGMAMLSEMERRMPGRVVCRFSPTEEEAGGLLAAADLLLCLSEREGEAEVLRGLRYGTPTMANLLSAGDHLSEECGFLYRGAVDFLQVFRRAEEVFAHRGAWGQLCRAAVRAPLSDWKSAGAALSAFARGEGIKAAR